MISSDNAFREEMGSNQRPEEIAAEVKALFDRGDPQQIATAVKNNDYEALIDTLRIDDEEAKARIERWQDEIAMTRDIELTDEAYAVLMSRQRDDESISETIERLIDEYEETSGHS